MRKTSRRLAPVAMVALMVAAPLGCEEDTGDNPTTTVSSESESQGTETTGTTESDSQGSSETGDEPEVGWFDVGFGEDAFVPIEDGAEMHIVWGSQGAAMFPMPIRAGEFTLPDNPKDFTDERAPMLELTVDIEGFNDGIGGHFKRIANYPIAFDIMPDGTYEFIYVRVIVPDTIDPRDLDGLPAHLWVELDPWGSAPLTIEYDLTVRVDDPPF